MKRKYGYIGLSIIVLIFGVIVLPNIMKRASNGEIVKNDRLSAQNQNNTVPTNKQRNKAETRLAFLGSQQNPKKIPPFQFTDQNGETISNKDYEGKVYLAEFFFTTCPTICPKMNKEMVKIQNKFLGEEDFGIASFSINPAHDTPEVLKNYAGDYGVKDTDWHMMTGDRDSIYELANNGFNLYAGINKNVDGNFEHSGYFALVDRNGYIRSRRGPQGNPIGFYNALDEEEMEKLIEDIRKLL